jgi:hypothetical protein
MKLIITISSLCDIMVRFYVQYKNDSDEWAHVQVAGEQMNNDDSDELWNSPEDGEFKKYLKDIMRNWLCYKVYVYML